MGVDDKKARHGVRRVRLGPAIAGLAAIVGIATGIVTLGNQLFSTDSGSGPTPTAPSLAGAIPRYDGIAGHLAQGRALLDFLEQNDRQSVYLDVGFPDLATGPAGGRNVTSRMERLQNGDISHVSELRLMTKCSVGVPPGTADPTPADGCMGTALHIAGPETKDAYTFFEHGVPRIKGYFLVDVTGGLYQGITPIILRPLSFDQARARRA